MNNLYNLQEQYFFYKKYHLNTTNVLIHIGCIPMIVWTFCVFLTHFSSNIFYNPTFLMVNLYSWYYRILHEDLGRVMQLLLYMSWISSYFFYWYVSNSLKYTMLLHIGAWVAQFIGHFYFEGNRPALTDSLVQAFLIAPMFVLIDIQYLIEQRTSNHN
jgi:uncharacterized membrane protein YGL010W